MNEIQAQAIGSTNDGEVFQEQINTQPRLADRETFAGEPLTVDKDFIENAYLSLIGVQGTMAVTGNAFNALEDELTLKQKYKILTDMTEQLLQIIGNEIGAPVDEEGYKILETETAKLVVGLRQSFEL
jgi:hypothetical protein